MPREGLATRPSPAAEGQRYDRAGPQWGRGEDAPLVTGQGMFVGDVVRDGELFLRVVRSPIAHGRIVSLDVAAARAADGVELALSAQDLDEVPDIPLRISNRPQLAEYLQPVLATSTVRYVGEPIAIVVARTAREAEDAADLVEFDIEELEPVVDVDGEQVDPVWPAAPDGRLCSFVGRTGDFDEVAKSADLVVAQEFDTERDTGLPLETRGLVAEWNPAGTELHLWGPTKFVRFTRASVAAWFQLEPAQVVCHRVDVGGMFGPRGELYPEDFLVPLASRLLGRPVSWVEDRSEHFLAINHSRGQRHRISVAVNSDGTLLGLKDEILQDFGAYARPIGGRLIEIPVEAIPGPYRWPVVDLVCYAVATNKTPMGTMRGPGTFDAGFVRERMMDIVAARLDLDPLEFRRRNLITADEMPYEQSFGSQMHPSVYDSGDFPLVLDELMKTIDVDAIRNDLHERRGRGELVGFGVGFFLAHAGLGIEESIKLEVTEEGRLHLFTAASEIGQGLATMLRIVVAEVLGVSHDLIDVTANSTERFDGGTGTFSARSTIFSGSAARDAAQQLLSELRNSHPLADPAAPETWRLMGPRSIIGTHRQDHPNFGFGVHAAVVRIDSDTLEPTVERFAVAYDCGRAIDRPSLIGQIAGAAIQGIGGTFLQRILYDDRGQPQSTTFMDYLVPTVFDAPAVEVVLLELPGTTSNPLGVKGGGEAGIMGAGGALSNAFADAVGEPESVTRLPIAPDLALRFVPAVAGQDGAAPTPHTQADEVPSDDGPTPRSRGRLRRYLPVVVAAVAGAIGLAWWLRGGRVPRPDRVIRRQRGQRGPA